MDQIGSTHPEGIPYTIIGSLSEFCCPKGKLGITRFSKSDFILSIYGYIRGYAVIPL